ncbi:MAG TPA: hypothetical protein VHG29_12020 [Novosphingobium sp.]|nr:hypothetical protein [Novosphingobium sp.]
MAESTTPKKAPAKKPTPKANTAPKRAAAPKKAVANGSEAKARFSKAIDEARSGAQALARDVQDKSGAYREKLSSASNDWIEEAKVMGDQAKERATALAKDGKSRASDAISGLGKVVADNAGAIDEKLGTRYGDYARTAARTMQETAAKIESRDFDELGEDARQMVRKSPGIAIGIAAVIGFMFARLFRGGKDS